MTETAPHAIHSEVLKILLVLALSLILGFERETKKADATHYYFGGVATFPLIGLAGFGLAALSAESMIPLGVGLAVIGGFLLISYRHKLDTSKFSGFVTELTGLVAYLQGAMVFFEHYWMATTLVVLNLIILELKRRLELFSKKMPSEEAFILARFLFLTAVILPVVPNKELTQFQLNPFKIWLVVVAVSGLSYLSYLLQRWLKDKGVLVSALIGGAYSSTAVTVTLAKRSKEAHRPNLYAGSVLISSGLVFLRVLILLAIFSRAVMGELLLPFLVLAVAVMLGGYLWSRRREPKGPKLDEGDVLKNPLEILSAFLFAGIFITVVISTHLVVKFIGVQGIYYLAILMGAFDVDPFVLGLAQNASLPPSTAAIAVTMAVSGNNLVKGGYALIFGEAKMARQAAAGLGLLSLAGFATILLLI